MKMNHFLVLTCLVSLPSYGQLPDEINYGPYENRYQAVDREVKLQEERLKDSRSALRDVQSFMREMGQHLTALETQIRQNEEEINLLRREIPELERRLAYLKNEDYRADMQLRNRQQEEVRLSHRFQQEDRELRRMEREIGQRLQRLTQLESELNQLRLAEKKIGTKYADLQKDLGRISHHLEEARIQIRKFQDDLSRAEGQLNNLSSRIVSLESSLRSLDISLNTEKANATNLKGLISDQERELMRLRTSNASAGELRNATQRLASTKQDLAATQRNIGTIQSQLSKSQGELRLVKTQFSRIQNDQREIPGRIKTLESKISQLEGERGRVTSEVSRTEIEFQNIKRNADRQEQLVMSSRAELRPDQERITRQRQHIEAITRDLNLLRTDINILIQRIRSLNQEMAVTQNTIVTHTKRVPVLMDAIRKAQTEISTGEDDLERARNDERGYSEQVASLEGVLREVKTRRDAALSEMARRKNLYENYLEEAQKSGGDQALIAKDHGRKAGEKLATSLSQSNGSAMGKELGAIEARLWGSVRGEINGYSSGHQEGLRSLQDISNATQEASLKASQDAEMFAQTNLRPVFFEEFILEEFKKPSGLQKQITKAFKRISFNSAMREQNEVVPPLTQEEMQESLSIVTPLDSVITQLNHDFNHSKQKIQRVADPEAAYTAPVTIPTGVVDCSRVYKGLEVFKKSCERSYRDLYQHYYLNSVKSVFVENYEALYWEYLAESNSLQRESSFIREFKDAFEIGKSFGVTIGKKQIYASTFKNVYDSQYAVELEKAKVRARNAAEIGLRDFLKVNPLLTVTGKSVDAEFFRGGEEVTLSLKIKNVGNVHFDGPVVGNITSLENAQILHGEGILNHVPALGVAVLSTLKVKVLPTARTGEKMVIKGVVHLPGDAYKASRLENFELVQILAANPSHDFKVDFNPTPSIKGVFKRYIHSVNVKLTPNVEDIIDGYEVALNVLEESRGLIDIKETQILTGALKLGNARDLKFSYTLKNEAKGKELRLQVRVSYMGKTIREELLKVNPK